MEERDLRRTFDSRVKRSTWRRLAWVREEFEYVGILPRNIPENLKVSMTALVVQKWAKGELEVRQSS